MVTHKRQTARGSVLSLTFIFIFLLAFAGGLSAQSYSAYRLGITGQTCDIVSDNNGGVHILWSDDGVFHYGRITAQVGGGYAVTGGETISSMTGVTTTFRYPRIRVRPDGSTVHIAWSKSDNSIYHTWRNSVGTWQTEQVYTASGLYSACAGVTTDGTVHIAGIVNYKNVIYFTKSPGQSWVNRGNLTSTNIEKFRVMVVGDPQGGIHAGWTISSTAYSQYVETTAGGLLQSANVINSSQDNFPWKPEEVEYFVESSGRVHLAYKAYNGQQVGGEWGSQVRYQVKNVGAGFSSPEQASEVIYEPDTPWPPYTPAPAIVVDGGGRPFISWAQDTGQTVKLARREATGWVVQTIDTLADVSNRSKPAMAITSTAGYLVWRSENPAAGIPTGTSEFLLGVLSFGSLTLTAPNGGESWLGGSTQNITWSATGVTGNVTLELWRDGALVGTIAENLAISPASYSWTTGSYIGGTAAAGGGYKVRIKTVSAGYADDSNATFSILPQALTVTAPNGGEEWIKGSTQAITWSSVGVSANLTLELWRNGTKVGTIAENVPVTPASYSWTAGNYVGGTADGGSGYSIRIVAGGVSDSSDATFALLNPGVYITTPNGGESWTRHDIQSIQWRAVGVSGNVKLELLRNGTPIGTIVSDIPAATGTYRWDVGLVNGAFPPADTTYTVRISTMDNLSIDTSDAMFAIVNRVPVLPAQSDYNLDNKTDIFWRYMATGGYNCVWLMGLTASSAPVWQGFQMPVDMNDLPPAQEVDDTAMGVVGAPESTLNAVSFSTESESVDDIMDGPNADPPVADPRTLSYARNLPTIALLDWRLGGIADFDHDGNTDILWRNYADGRNVVWLMNGYTIRSVSQLQATTNLSWEICGVGDFNGDDQIDIVWRNNADGRNVVWLMNGYTISQVLRLTSETDLNWRIAGVCDFNNDGYLDLMWRNISDGRNAVWLLNRAGERLGVSSLSTVANLNWDMAAFGDFTADGEMDIVWRNYADGRVVVWKMDRYSLMSTVALTTVTDAGWKIQNN